MNEKKLKEYFSPIGTSTSCIVMSGQSHVSRGFEFVCFSEPEEATKAITELKDSELGNEWKPIFVAMA